MEKRKSELKKKKNPNKKKKKIFFSPLHKAIFNNAVRRLMVRLLIENGADVNLPNSSGNTALHYAVRLGRRDLVKVKKKKILEEKKKKNLLLVLFHFFFFYKKMKFF